METHVLPLAPDVVETRKDTLKGRGVFRPRTALRTLLYVRRLVGFIRRHQIDIVHTNSLKADVIGGIAARLARVRLIWHVRDRIETDYLPAPAVRAFRGLCRYVPDYVIANSEATLRTLHLPKQTHSEAIHNGINLPRHYGINLPRHDVVHDGIASPQEPPAVAAPSDVLQVGLVGRITPWKGQHIFVEAAARVAARFSKVRFLIVGKAMFGEEEYEAQVRARVTELGLDRCLEFTGHRSDISTVMRQLDVLVHASTTGEPFGQVVIEGMAASTPVVATRGGGIPEIVQDGVTGLLVPMGDAEAMATAILRLLTSPDQALALGAAGFHHVSKHFTLEATARRVERVYDGFYHRDRRPNGQRRPLGWL